MLDIFECQNSVEVMGSKQYDNVLKLNPEMKFSRSKTAGHFVARVKTKPGQYFFGVKDKGKGANVNIRYSL